MPLIHNIVESSLYVADLERSQQFYERVLGFREIAREDGRLHALAVGEKQVLLLFRVGQSTEPTHTPGGRIPPHDGRGTLHMAYATDREALTDWRDHLREAGVAIESEVDCEKGGHSIYFRDPDGHLLELITPGCWTVY